jgi:hypothetical protein
VLERQVGATAANDWQANFTGVRSHPRNLSAKRVSAGIGTGTKRTIIRLIRMASVLSTVPQRSALSFRAVRI